MEDIEKIIAQTKAEIDSDDKLQRCAFCVWNEQCTKKSYYAPHCKDYLTSEQAVRVLAIQEQQKAQKELARLQLKMDIMSYLINGAMAEMEDIDKELEQSYNRLQKKDAECERNHAECKRNRKRLIDAYKRMKYSMKNIDSDYRNYVEHYFSTIFGDEDGSFNVQEYDKSSVNSGMVRAFVVKFIDISLENGENCKAVFDFMNGLQGSGLLTNRDFTNCLIKK